MGQSGIPCIFTPDTLFNRLFSIEQQENHKRPGVWVYHDQK